MISSFHDASACLLQMAHFLFSCSAYKRLVHCLIPPLILLVHLSCFKILANFYACTCFQHESIFHAMVHNHSIWLWFLYFSSHCVWTLSFLMAVPTETPRNVVPLVIALLCNAPRIICGAHCAMMRLIFTLYCIFRA